jgi:hypothetical protein
MESISNVQEIADAVIFLTEALHITGEVLHVEADLTLVDGKIDLLCNYARGLIVKTHQSRASGVCV